MSDFDSNPFASPFSDSSVTQATSESQKPSLDDFNPFGSGSSSVAKDTPPAVVVPSDPPPSFNNYGSGNLSAPPVAAPIPPAVIPGHDELLRRQEELERKAEELQQRERAMGAHSRISNWPPVPKCCPVGPCFYQDFDVDIPNEFRVTVKMLYYLWIFYAFILFNNVFVCMAIFIVTDGTDNTVGPQFGLSILWFIVNVPLSLCWYRPVYKAFRSDSSFNFFLFFFLMFFQICFSIIMAVGIPGSGWAGWIVTASYGFPKSIGVGIYSAIQSSLFTVMCILSLMLLKKVHSIYRTTGASFEKAQQEFAAGAVKNPGVQQAAAAAASSAVEGSLQGRY